MTMNLPTIATMVKRGYTLDQATKIRGLMERFRAKGTWKWPKWTLERIAEIIGGEEIEFIPKGANERSPAIRYINMGDTYAETIMWVEGRFVLGDWGSIVERGNYSMVKC